MRMTKSHFEFIADTIRYEMDQYAPDNTECRGALRLLARRMARRLNTTNASFDSYKFLVACGVEDSIGMRPKALPIMASNIGAKK